MSANAIAVARSPKSLPLDARSQYLRRLIVDALVGGERGHIGSSMSPLEILRVLYDDVLHHRPREPGWPERDRCILSKGHGCLALYAVLADKGYFPLEILKTFCRKGSILVAIQSTAKCREWKPRPVHSATGSRSVSAWRWRRACASVQTACS